MSGLSLQFLRVGVDVPQSIVEQVRRIRKAAVYVDGRRIEATKLTVFPEAATPSNTFRARLELPENATDLYPGMFVKVGFVVGEAERLLVPGTRARRAQRSDGGLRHRRRGRTSLRQVRLGHHFGDRVEVLAGLAAGERVALDPIAAMKRLNARRRGGGRAARERAARFQRPPRRTLPRAISSRRCSRSPRC